MKVEILEIYIPVVAHTDQELQEGAILSPAQKAMIRKHMVAAAQELCNLDVDPNNVSSFIQQQSSLKGELRILQHQLDLSEAAEEMVRNKVVDQNQQ